MLFHVILLLQNSGTTSRSALLFFSMKRLNDLLPRFVRQRAHSQVPFDTIAPDSVVWVVGDIHGRADLLERLIEKIDAHPQASQESHAIFVGDYIDRGNQSARVLEHLHAWSQSTTHIHCLMGNHEELLLKFLEDPKSQGRRWLRYGGLQTLASYGIGGFGEGASEDQLAQIADRLAAAMPDGMLGWLESLPAHWSSGNLHVVHAGANPKHAMDDQRRGDLIWGHPDFATTPRSDGQWIVHGHTITDTPGSDGQGRIAVDTGAYYSGRLTAALITPDGTVDLLHT